MTDSRSSFDDLIRLAAIGLLVGGALCFISAASWKETALYLLPVAGLIYILRPNAASSRVVRKPAPIVVTPAPTPEPLPAQVVQPCCCQRPDPVLAALNELNALIAVVYLVIMAIILLALLVAAPLQTLATLVGLILLGVLVAHAK
jgi:small-conductance mechanosensitive channel